MCGAFRVISTAVTYHSNWITVSPPDFSLISDCWMTCHFTINIQQREERNMAETTLNCVWSNLCHLITLYHALFKCQCLTQSHSFTSQNIYTKMKEANSSSEVFGEIKNICLSSCSSQIYQVLFCRSFEPVFISTFIYPPAQHLLKKKICHFWSWFASSSLYFLPPTQWRGTARAKARSEFSLNMTTVWQMN